MKREEIAWAQSLRGGNIKKGEGMMTSCQGLVVLDLSGNRLGSAMVCQLASVLEGGGWLLGINLYSSTLTLTAEAMKALRSAVQANSAVVTCVVRDGGQPDLQRLQQYEDLLAMTNDLVTRDWPTFTLPPKVETVLQSWKLKNQSLVLALTTADGADGNPEPPVPEQAKSPVRPQDVLPSQPTDADQCVPLPPNPRIPNGRGATKSIISAAKAPKINRVQHSGKKVIDASIAASPPPPPRTSVETRPAGKVPASTVRPVTAPVVKPTRKASTTPAKSITTLSKRPPKTMNVRLNGPALLIGATSPKNNKGKKGKEQQLVISEEEEVRRLSCMEQHVMSLSHQVAMMEEWMRRQQPSTCSTANRSKELHVEKDELVREITTQIQRRIHEMWG